MELSYACTSEGENGCKDWKQTGISGTKDEPDAFKVDIGYSCGEYSANGNCIKWSQNGKAVKEGGSGCFPGSTLVLTRQGPLAMSKVKVGDELLGRDSATGAIAFSRVRAFLHREVETETEMTVLVTSAGRVVVSPKHSIAVDQSRYRFASDLKIGDSLIAPDGTTVTLLEKKTENARGLYSPFTTSSHYFAGESENSMVLAHNFAHVWWPDYLAIVLHRIFDIVELLWPQIHNVHAGDVQYVHPVAQRLAPLVGINI